MEELTPPESDLELILFLLFIITLQPASIESEASMSGKSEYLVSQYEASLKKYERFDEKIKQLLKEVLTEAGIATHSITSRCKDLKSLKKKIGKKEEQEKRYNGLADITDLVGLRVITHFSDDVDHVAKVVESVFLIDKDNSIDKRKSLDSDRFGYMSLHYVVSLSESRIVLPEYKLFAGLKAEIQIRSILQHAWAEIEHDLGYKAGVGVPKEVKRRFSRLASLLEIADEEFASLRALLTSDSRVSKSGISMDKLILFIDDQRNQLNYYMEAVEEAGYKTIFCDSADNGLTCIRDRHGEVALVVLDIRMSPPQGVATTEVDEGGISLLRQAKETIQDNSIPVIVLSNLDKPTLERAVNEQGLPTGLVHVTTKTETAARALPPLITKMLHQWKSNQSPSET